MRQGVIGMHEASREVRELIVRGGFYDLVDLVLLQVFLTSFIKYTIPTPCSSIHTMSPAATLLFFRLHSFKKKKEQVLKKPSGQSVSSSRTIWIHCLKGRGMSWKVWLLPFHYEASKQAWGLQGYLKEFIFKLSDGWKADLIHTQTLF